MLTELETRERIPDRDTVSKETGCKSFVSIC